MTRAQVRTFLDESIALGVKEYYFTGGEPFMNQEIVEILEDTLQLGPATVLTNATLLPERTVAALARTAAQSLYSLELRVSLDGVTAEMNDAIRGAGAFDRCLSGVRRLVSAGFLPIITTMQSWPDQETEALLDRFRGLLSDVGYDRARLKILPPLLIGEEAKRSRAYDPMERVSHQMLQGFDMNQLICSSARVATARGVYVCPILLETPSAKVGETLEESVGRPAKLSESACYTCYLHGSICSNMPVSGRDHS